MSLVFLVACAAQPAKPVRPPRIPDSPPERAAATRAATGGPNLNLEAEDELWQIDEQKEVKRLEKEKAEAKKQQGNLIPMPRLTPDGGVAPQEIAPTK